MEAPVVEEPQTRRLEFADVEVFSLIEKLEIDEVADAIASRLRHRVELLRDLVIMPHDRDRTRRR